MTRPRDDGSSRMAMLGTWQSMRRAKRPDLRMVCGGCALTNTAGILVACFELKGALIYCWVQGEMAKCLW